MRVRAKNVNPAEMANIKAMREARRMTAAEVAKAIGVTQSYVAQLETGKKIPSQKVYDKIRLLFDGSLWEISHNGEWHQSATEPEAVNGCIRWTEVKDGTTVTHLVSGGHVAYRRK